MIVVLYEPEIPPNTGNVARTCAAWNAELHLIEPLGFSLDNKYLKRAGLDYWPNVSLRSWPDWRSFLLGGGQNCRLVLFTTKAATLLPEFSFNGDDALVFGPETRGLPPEILAFSPWRVRVPSRRPEEGGVRSLNLSSAVAVGLYAALVSSGQIEAFDSQICREGL